MATESLRRMAMGGRALAFTLAPTLRWPWWKKTTAVYWHSKLPAPRGVTEARSSSARSWRQLDTTPARLVARLRTEAAPTRLAETSSKLDAVAQSIGLG